jgi:putative transposase
VLQIAPSAYWLHAARQHNCALSSAREKRDQTLMPQIERVWHANMQVYGADKVWKQLRREGIEVARCTVERLMRRCGLQGIVRGKKKRTTIADKAVPCPLDRVHRQFKASAAESVVGIGLYIRVDLAGIRLCRLCHRRLCPPHRRLAGQYQYAD